MTRQHYVTWLSQCSVALLPQQSVQRMPVLAVLSMTRNSIWSTEIWVIDRTGSTLLQAFAAKYMRTALFYVITQRLVVIYYRLFRTTYRSHPQGFFYFWILRMILLGRTETSVWNYHYSFLTNQKSAVLIFQVKWFDKNGHFYNGYTCVILVYFVYLAFSP